MIVIFGASSDLGRRITQKLLDHGDRIRLISSDPSRLDPLAERRTGDLSASCNPAPLLDGAEVVVSCAHARHTTHLVNSLPASVRKVVLTGSAWRYSRVPDPRGQAVRDAETAFLASGLNGVILHPTMIYGGTQENNIQRLLALIERWPFVPAPGGGRHLVQPIHIEDAAACVLAAIRREWSGAHALAVAGPCSMRWREMVKTCMKIAGVHRPILSLPLAPAIGAIRLAEIMGLRSPVDVATLHRFREDVDIPLAPMSEQLGITPRAFDVGLQEAVQNWRSSNMPSNSSNVPKDNE